MIWVYCIFGLLIFNAISCTSEISHEKRIRSQRSVPGAVVIKDPNDTKYYDLAKFAMRKYGKHSVKGYLVLQVAKATEQVVSGLITEIEFYATPTYCKAPECHVVIPYTEMYCHSTISEQLWMYDRDVSTTCDPA